MHIAMDKKAAIPAASHAQGQSPAANTRGKKRAREDGTSKQRKRRRTPNLAPEDAIGITNSTYTDPIDCWRRSGFRWPQGDWSKKPAMDKDPGASNILARKRSTGSLRRKRSDIELGTESSITPSDQKSREAKSAPYRDVRYSLILATKGSHLKKDDLGITDMSKQRVKQLLSTEQTVPQDSLFRDDIFEITCSKLEERNEYRVLRDIALLIVPSAEILTTYGAKELACLTESLNEGWNNSIPFVGTRPQPDYAVGFHRDAFTEQELKKLEPFVGDVYSQSFFMGTYYQYFPFLTCEVKCGAQALDVADRQNAHSMTLAVRAVVELFRLVKRDQELDREILAFSISHDHKSVRIYGHYPVIEETKTSFYRYPIRDFGFTELDGRDKWAAYKFTKSVYLSWMPDHLKRLKSAIAAVPDVNFNLSQSDLQFSEPSVLSQDLAAMSAGSALSAPGGLEPSEPAYTPDTSFTKDTAQGRTTKAKRGRR